ncbi:MAG: hypothetical protein ACR2QV_03000 [Gammaproteobacteria bacterium]
MFNRNQDWSKRFEAVCYTVAFFVIAVASPIYGILSLNNLPIV